MDLVRDLRREGISIVWIEHIVHALLGVVDRIVAISFGRKLIEGDPNEVMCSDEVMACYMGGRRCEPPRAEQVDVFYGDFQALFSISLAVDEGATFAVIGANGAGKSTLLKTIAGVLRPRSGRVLFEGEPVDHVSVHRRVGMGISLVPEGRRVFPSLTVIENLQMGAYRARRGDWNLAAVMELFPLLEPLAKRQAASLSGGEQQALAIGRSLMSNPRLILLDEVSLGKGLAPVVIKRIYEAMAELPARGTTVLVVEQDVQHVLTVADGVACFLAGRISLEGHPSEITPDAITAAYFGV